MFISVLLLAMSMPDSALAVECGKASLPASWAHVTGRTKEIKMDDRCYICVYKPMTRDEAHILCNADGMGSLNWDNINDLNRTMLTATAHERNKTYQIYHAPINMSPGDIGKGIPVIVVKEGGVSMKTDQDKNSKHAFICMVSSRAANKGVKHSQDGPYSHETAPAVIVVLICLGIMIIIVVPIVAYVVIALAVRRSAVSRKPPSPETSTNSNTLVHVVPPPTPSSNLSPEITTIQQAIQDPASPKCGSAVLVDLACQKQPNDSFTTKDCTSAPHMQVKSVTLEQVSASLANSDSAVSQSCSMDSPGSRTPVQ